MAGVAADLSVLYRKQPNVGQCTRRDHYTTVSHRCPRTDILLPGLLRRRTSALQMWTRILAIFGHGFKTRERSFASQVLLIAGELLEQGDEKGTVSTACTLSTATVLI